MIGDEEWASGKFISVTKWKRKMPWNGMIQKRRRIDDPELNPQVWGRTPLDIQRHILTLLPLPALCRFKAVSKAWRSAISNGTLDFRFRTQRWYLMTGFRCLGLLDGNSGFAWKLIDVPNLQGKGDEMIHDIVISYSTGLVLGFQGTERVKLAAVFNPLVQDSWLRLPQPPLVTRDGISAVVFFGIQAQDASDSEKHTNSTPYIVVQLLGFSSSAEYYRLELQVYSSRVGGWTSTPVPPQPLGKNDEAICISVGYQHSVLLREDHLFFTTAAKDNTRSLKSMSVWNPCKVKTIATWTDLPLYMIQDGYLTNASFPGMGPYHCSLHHCAGKFVLVGLIPLEQNELSGSVFEDERLATVGILALDEREARKGWQVLTRLPLEILPQKLREGVEMLDGLIVTAASEDEVTLHLRGGPWGGIYNVTDGTWRSAFGDGLDGGTFFPFTPSLSNLP